MNIQWIIPQDLIPDQWNKWLASHAPGLVEKLFADHGVTVISVNPTDAFYGYLQVQKDGRNFKIGLNEIASEHSLKELAGFLRHWDKTTKAYADSARITDPFFDNLYLFIKSAFKDCQGKGKAIMVLCDWVKADGRRVWT